VIEILVSRGADVNVSTLEHVTKPDGTRDPSMSPRG
jgi:hypothetical protein